MKNKLNVFLIVIVLISIVSTVLFYPHLPEMIPGHYNLHGEIDRYISKEIYSILSNLIIMGLGYMMMYIPTIDNEDNSCEKFNDCYGFIVLIIMIFFLVIHIFIMLSSLVFIIDVNRVVCFLLGLLFMGIGYCMNGVKPNYFIGVKTPWTLSNERVWDEANRLFGKVSVMCGWFMLLSSLAFRLKVVYVVILISIIIISVVPLVGSYIFYKNEVKK